MRFIDDLKRVAESLRQEAEHAWTDARASDSRAMAHMFRPDLGATPEPLRRFLEPVVAGAALVALATLAGFSLAALVTLFVTAGLIYMIITYVFGIQLDFELPSRPW